MNHVGAQSNNPLTAAGYTTNEARAQFPRTLLSRLANIGSLRAFCIGVNVDALSAPRDDPVDWACQLLFERCQFLLDQEGERSAHLFFDNEQERKRDIADNLREGTYYRRTDGFIEPAAFYPSKDSPGLQVADFVAGAANRLWNHDHNFYIRILWDRFYRQHPHTPLGSGIKSFPDPHYQGL